MKTRIITGLIFTAIILAFLLPAFVYKFLPLILFLAVNIIAGHELVMAVKNKISFEVGLKFLIYPWTATFLLPLLIVPLSVNQFFNSNLILTAELKSGVLADILAELGLVFIFAGIYFLFSTIILACKFGTKVLLPAFLIHAAGLYLLFPTTTVTIMVSSLPNGYYWLILAIFSPWVSDVGAYFTGYFLGKRKLLPHISPKKTVAGFFGGIFFSIIACLLANKLLNDNLSISLFQNNDILLPVLTGLFLSLASQLGDWFASAIKRELAIKDFGNLLPGHGGILDRFDSVLFTLPTTLLVIVAFLYI